ncbi:MAG: hypothetical protein Q4D29_12425, partial [Lachnospiraceae bacterium]|nr:hypothetical protein [Lachnospiraceae bacterium]
MALNINTTNYINSQAAGANNGQNVSSSVNVNVEGTVISVRGLDLQAGQTISGQVVDIDGKDIKLLLSNNQTINARLEGNINALLGQTLSFEVKNTENGQTALRPLYTNLNNSETVTMAIKSAGLPLTDGYAKMVSSMMDESMPINKDAIYDMSKQINNFPNANPDTIVKLTKLGLQVNELTINQYENYKGFEHQIKSNVDTISKGVADLIKDSLLDTVKQSGITDITQEKTIETVVQNAAETVKTGGKNLLTAFLNALNGANQENPVDEEKPAIETLNNEEITAETEETVVSNRDTFEGKQIDSAVFDTSRLVLEMVDENEASETIISSDMKDFVSDFSKLLEDTKILSDSNNKTAETDTTVKSVKEDLLDAIRKEVESASGTPLKDDIAKLTDTSVDNEISV